VVSGYPKAVPNFQKAAEIDPDYINAWKQLAEIGGNYQLDPNVRDEAVFNILRLDPAGRRINPDTTSVRDLAKLWAVQEACVQALPPQSTTLLSLRATAAKMMEDQARMEKAACGLDPEIMKFYETQMAREEGAPKDATTPRTSVLGNGIISTALEEFR
jgi:hypothetical protein